MTNVYRTLARNAGYVGIVGCLLAGTPALAAGSTYVRNVTGTADGGNWVRVTTRAQFNSTLYGNRYTTLPVQVSKTTLRQGAIYALGRGVMHPSFHVAIAAAGFIWSQQYGIQVPDTTNAWPEFDLDGYTYRVRLDGFLQSGIEDSYSAAYGRIDRFSSSYPVVTGFTNSGDCSYNVAGNYIRNSNGTTLVGYSWRIEAVCNGENYQAFNPDVLVYDTYNPATESDLEQIDQHIPVDIVQDLYGNNFSIPQWQDAISVMGQPASGVESSGQIMPEVASAVGKWGENMAAQSQGEPLPHPDQSDNWRTPQEEYYDRELDDNENSSDWDGEIPPFDDLDVEWQTETLELPAFSSGIGGGGCPGSAAISLPLGQSMTIDYQPACDLATMVKPGVIGSAGMIALLIVLRARGGS